jgi:hypothetical protein
MLDLLGCSWLTHEAGVVILRVERREELWRLRCRSPTKRHSPLV